MATRKAPPLTGMPDLPEFIGKAALRAARKWNVDSTPHIQRSATGSPGFKPSRAQAQAVERLAALGLSPKEISDVLRIEKTLLEFYYDYELKTAAHRINAAVGKVALDMALSGADSDMTKFWLQARAGWTTKTQVDHTGVDKDADDARAAREKLLQSADVPEAAGGGKEETSSDT